MNQPRKISPGKAIGIAALLVLGIPFLMGLFGIGADDGDSSKSDKPAASTPAYEIVEQDDSGNTRNVTVEVTSTKGLRQVFDAVAAKLTNEAGYFVYINCSTGGTKDVDNRLATGKKAVGNGGAAATGLKSGGTEFSTNEGRDCPAKD